MLMRPYPALLHGVALHDAFATATVNAGMFRHAWWYGKRFLFGDSSSAGIEWPMAQSVTFT